jgi:hypothetical protein
LQLLVNHPPGQARLAELLARRRELKDVISCQRRGQVFPVGCVVGLAGGGRLTAAAGPRVISYILKRLRSLVGGELANYRWAGALGMRAASKRTGGCGG